MKAMKKTSDAILNREGSDIGDEEVRSRNAQLFAAIGDDNLPEVERLLESGVKTNIISEENIEGNTPLHYAIEKGEAEIVRKLLDAKWKTDLSLRNTEGKTPLEIARQTNNQEIINLLETIFEKTKDAAAIEGQLFEINMVTFLLLKGKLDDHIAEFYLAANFKKAYKFDDVVFSYTNETRNHKTLFVQCKHKTAIHSVTFKDLLSKKESDNFSLKKYFISYRKIKQHFLTKEKPIFSGEFDQCEFLMYTNAPFDHQDEKAITQIAMDDKDLFKIKDSKGKCYQLLYSGRIFDNFKNSSDFQRLAKALSKAFNSKQGLDINQDIFASYHKALKERVFQKSEGSYGILSKNFFSDDAGSKFRTMFFKEAAKVFNKSEHEIEKELSSKPINLSKNFWDENASGSPELPNDDPIEVDEVKKFLNKFKLYADQPSEQELEKSIKEIAKTSYYIQQQDIDPVYADVVTKVKNWWQHERYYLMKDNKFFEDSLKILVEFDVIGPVASFTGREQILVELHRKLQEGGAVSISQIAKITGLGGIGKSELARKYLSEYKKHYDNNIIWINAENRSTITRSFQKLAQDKLKINTADEKNNEKDTQVLADEVYNYFAKANRKSIFIFDNAHKPLSGEKYLDKLLPSGENRPYVIITTRDQDWHGINNLPLGLFTQEEAEAFVKNALKGKIKIEDNELQTLIKELGCLPLALGQAVAYISVKNVESETWSDEKFTISCYLNEFHENAKNEILSFDEVKDHTVTVMTTWITSIEKIKLESERAFKILNVISYLAPDEIPIDEIFATEKSDQNKIRRATELLEQYSMIHIERGNVNIHRLVQKVTRKEIEAKDKNEQILESTFALLKAWYHQVKSQQESQQKDYNLKKQRMLPHLEVFLSHIEDLIKKRPKGRVQTEKMYLFDLLDWIADGYEHNPERRKELEERALIIKKNNYEPDHFQLAFTLENLGNSYGTLGDAQKKKELQERALKIKENFYGPDHFQVAITLENLANAHGALDNAQKKKELLEDVLKIRENYFGSDHFQVAKTLDNLANAYGDSGDKQKKKELLERALKIRQAHYEPDNI